MDIEAPLRKELIEYLRGSFVGFEEVELLHCHFRDLTIRADVVAIPLDAEYFDNPIAFEVKRLSDGRENHYAEWAPAIKQASDYVYASIVDKRVTDFVGRRIVAAFAYPAPALQVNPQGQIDRETCLKMLTTGAFHAGLYFRVGGARWYSSKTGSGVSLSFGPNEVWSTKRGWNQHSKDLLTGKRKIGSQMIDVLGRLDGTRNRPDGPLWE